MLDFAWDVAVSQLEDLDLFTAVEVRDDNGYTFTDEECKEVVQFIRQNADEIVVGGIEW